MKQLTFAFVFGIALLAAPSLQAQKRKSVPNFSPTRSTTEEAFEMQANDRLLMQSGAVVLRRGGQSTGLTQNVRLASGTKVNVKSGIVELPGGKITTLMEGDYVKADGSIVYATPQSAAAARGQTAPAGAKFDTAVEVGSTTTTANVEQRMTDLGTRVDLMAQKIQLLNQKISLLSQGNAKVADTSQLDAQIKALDEQLRAVK